jgi:hypothetical protein
MQTRRGEDRDVMALVLTALDSRETDPARAAQANDRQLVEMWLNGLDSEEIARELGTESGAVRVRWTRLPARLRETARA